MVCGIFCRKRYMEVTQDNRFDIAPETKLWRYMSFAKFAALLHDRELVLSPLHLFEDPYEGAGGKACYMDKLADAMIDTFSQLGQTKEAVARLEAMNIDIDKQKEVMRLWMKVGNEYGQVNRMFTFVNCWHENEDESEAMWKLYTAHQPEGVAIQTTYEALKQAINEPEVKIGRITYENFDHAFMPGDSYGWYKRKSFEHEREVRVMAEPDDEQRRDMAKGYDKGNQYTVLLPVDLGVFIKNVYVSPYAQPWFKELVETEMKLSGLDKPVVYSKMNEQALFFFSRKQLHQMCESAMRDKSEK